MLRPPSNQKQRDDYFSGDPAFVQLERGELDDEAWSKARDERARQVRIARETGDWSPLLVQGSQPTKFVMRPLRSTVARTLGDLARADKLGSSMWAQLAFRAALVSCDEITVKFVDHPIYGQLAAESVVDQLDALNEEIVNELGVVVLTRSSPSPK